MLKVQNKLIPIRNFACSGQYNAAYLSLLVQRKKLKAKKIGRNFYTTEAWFNEYLERHARDSKKEKTTKKEESMTSSIPDSKPESNRAGFFVIRKFKLLFQASTVFVILLLVNFAVSAILGYMFPEKEKGKVLGAEEYAVSEASATSSVVIKNIKIQK